MRASASTLLVFLALSLLGLSLCSCHEFTAPVRGGGQPLASVEPAQVLHAPEDGGAEAPVVTGFTARVIGDSVALTIRLNKPAGGILPYPAWDWEIRIDLPALGEGNFSDTYALIARSSIERDLGERLRVVQTADQYGVNLDAARATVVTEGSIVVVHCPKWVLSGHSGQILGCYLWQWPRPYIPPDGGPLTSRYYVTALPDPSYRVAAPPMRAGPVAGRYGSGRISSSRGVGERVHISAADGRTGH
jgi:hypothetical protein